MLRARARTRWPPKNPSAYALSLGTLYPAFSPPHVCNMVKISRLDVSVVYADDLNIGNIHHTVAIQIIENAVGQAAGRIVQSQVLSIYNSVIVHITPQDFEALADAGPAAKCIARCILQRVWSASGKRRQEAADRDRAEGPCQCVRAEPGEARRRDAAEAGSRSRSNRRREDNTD